MKKTKIVATIGPASDNLAVLRKMMRAGMNVCRLNFSHGEYQKHKQMIQKIRRAAQAEKATVAIMADIQGPRVRVANKHKLVLLHGEYVFVTDEKSLFSHELKKELRLDWSHFYNYVRKGDLIYIEDGLISLEVVSRKKGGCVARVMDEGTVKPRKGVNIPSISSHLGFLTPKDVSDLEFILAQDVDYIAVSFVGSRSDLLALKGLMKQWQQRHCHRQRVAGKDDLLRLPGIVSKIERKKAMEHLEEIVEESDAVMVARGDLALEMPQGRVAVLQKDIIKMCLKKKKPVIVATQMLASMENNPRPTRAEVSDVTNAVIDQADAVMLSGETANGKYPLGAIQTMADIIQNAEASPYNNMSLKKVSHFAKMLLGRGKSKKIAKKTVAARTFKDALGYAGLRQENVTIKLGMKDHADRRRGILLWGTV